MADTSLDYSCACCDVTVQGQRSRLLVCIIWKYTRGLYCRKSRLEVAVDTYQPCDCECTLHSHTRRQAVHSVCRLVAGDVEGNFKQLFTRIEGILKKSGPFEACKYPRMNSFESINR
jgi:hypothetical protein